MEKRCSCCPNNNCFIKFCSAESKQLIELSKTVSRLKKNQYLFREGDSVDGIYILFSGKLKVFTSGYNDKAQTIRLAKEGYLIGHRGITDKYYSISAATLEDSIVCFIEKDLFHDILKRDTNLTYHLMLFYANELKEAESRMKTLAQMTVREKVIEALLLVAKTFGEKKNNSILINTILSRKDYAEIAGINPEQFIRILSDLKKEKLIKSTAKNITIINSNNFTKIIESYYTIHQRPFPN